MTARPPPPFLRAAPLDRELASGLSGLRSYAPSPALLSSVERSLEAQLLNEGLATLEATSSGVRTRPMLETDEPQVARAVASWDADQAHAPAATPPPVRWGALALSGMLGALAASVAIGVVAYRAGEIRSEARAPVATSAALAASREAALGPGSVAAGAQARMLPDASAASEEPAQPASAGERKAELGTARDSAAPRARSVASERAKPELVALDTAPGPAPVAREQGALNINSIPLSKVVLDGRPLGGTPRVRVPVVAGYHTVVFIHSVRGRIEKQVHVEAGSTVLAAVRFE